MTISIVASIGDRLTMPVASRGIKHCDMKDIKGFEGLYGVTNDGRVWAYPKIWKQGNTNSLASHTGKWMNPDKSNGYCKVRIRKDKKTYVFYVHRLVAFAFLENTNNFPDINHKNGIKTDNRVENLEWTTDSLNMRHAASTGLWNPYQFRGSKSNWAKLTENQVHEIKRSFLLAKWGNKTKIQKELAQKFNVKHGTIKSIVYGWRWKHLTAIGESEE